MDSAVYAVLGTISGVVITQVANYLLEEKRIKHGREDEQTARSIAFASELRSKRQEAYASCLAELDYFISVKKDRAEHLLSSFYSAVVVSSDEVSSLIAELLSKAQDNNNNVEELKKFKGKVVSAMRRDLTRGH